MAFPVPQYPKPVDEVFTLPQALARWAFEPRRVCINLADGQPPLGPPWNPRMKLDGATLYVHPWNEERAIRYLESLP